jgi:hypothetical protein
MTLNGEVLGKAKWAAGRLVEAERQVQLARADYHTLIRRLHLAGGSLREIAQALGLSHQRVQQIVNDAGGSWWQRVWRTRNRERDAVCTFCEGPPSEVSRLLAGPNVFICDACVDLAAQALSGRRGGPRPFRAAQEGSRAKCSFCAKKASSQRALVLAEAANLCADCLEVCQQILRAEEG